MQERGYGWHLAAQGRETYNGGALHHDRDVSIAVPPETAAAAAPPAHVTEPVGTRVSLSDDVPVGGRLSPIPRTEVTEPVSAQLPEPDLRFAETASLVVDVPQDVVEPPAPEPLSPEAVAPQPAPELRTPEPAPAGPAASEPAPRDPEMADPAIDVLPGRPAPLPEWPSADRDATQPVPRID